MSRAAAQSLGRIIFIAAVLIALLVVVTAARYSATRHVRRSSPAGMRARPMKGDVRRSEDGRLQYFDGRQWTATPPRPGDDAF